MQMSQDDGEMTHEGEMTHAQGTEEVDGLAGEGVNNGLDLAAANAVVLEDAHAHADAVLAGGRPVELLHAPIHGSAARTGC